MNTSLCPCGSAISYQQCCQPCHLDHAKATTPEKLMRARYSAHVLNLVDFIVQTYHSSCHAEQHRAAIAESTACHWVTLEVLNSSISANELEGFVEFKAHYIDNGQTGCLHEKSRFVQEKQPAPARWYYIDGEYPAPLQAKRNDPCPCGSGKKFKKCCGNH